MRSAAEAVAYAKTLHSLVRWIGICDGNMQEGSFRCDVNVSVRRPGEPLGTRREIKNLNSFKFMQQAIDYEVQWQIDTLENGGKIHQATVLFNPDTGETRAMRSKEEAHDYRYFPDPDLLPLEITEEWIQEIKVNLPEQPNARAERYQKEYGLPRYDTLLLTADESIGYYFESVCQSGPRVYININDKIWRPADPKLCANWVIGEVARKRNEENLRDWEFWVSPETSGRLLERIHDGTINRQTAKDLFETFWNEDKLKGGCRSPEVVDEVIAAKGLKQISDTGAIEKIVDEIIAANPAQVAEYRSGKEKVFGFFVGLVMKASKGKANPAQLNEVLKRKLSGG